MRDEADGRVAPTARDGQLRLDADDLEVVGHVATAGELVARDQRAARLEGHAVIAGLGEAPREVLVAAGHEALHVVRVDAVAGVHVDDGHAEAVDAEDGERAGAVHRLEFHRDLIADEDAALDFLRAEAEEEQFRILYRRQHPH